MAKNSRAALAPIIITEHDSDRLYRLALAHEDDMPEVSAFLHGEIARARIVKRHRVPPMTVTMNSVFEFNDESSGRERRITLVYPGHADIDRNRVSVMSPVGAALIGLSEGQSLTWDSGRGQRTVRVTRMVFQPEAEGLLLDAPPEL